MYFCGEIHLTNHISRVLSAQISQLSPFDGQVCVTVFVQAEFLLLDPTNQHSHVINTILLLGRSRHFLLSLD